MCGDRRQEFRYAETLRENAKTRPAMPQATPTEKFPFPIRGSLNTNSRVKTTVVSSRGSQETLLDGFETFISL